MNGTAYATAKREAHHKQAYIVKVTGARAEYCMRLLRPYMGARRGKRIDDCLAAAETQRRARSAERTSIPDELLVQSYLRHKDLSLRALAKEIGMTRRTLARRLNRLGHHVSNDSRATYEEHVPNVGAYPDLESCPEIGLAWLAGLIEGEGSIILTNAAPRISLFMTDLDVIERAARLLNTSVRAEKPKRSTWKEGFITSLAGRPACAFINLVLPYLGQRRHQRAAEVVSAFESHGAARIVEAELLHKRRYDQEGISRRWTTRGPRDSLAVVAKELEIGIETLRRRLLEWGVYEGKPSVTTRAAHRRQGGPSSSETS